MCNKNRTRLYHPPISQWLHRLGAPAGCGHRHVQRALFHPKEQPALQQHQPAPRSVCARPPRSRQVRTPACPLACFPAGLGFRNWGKKAGSRHRAAKSRVQGRASRISPAPCPSQCTVLSSGNAWSRFGKQIRCRKGQVHGEKSPSRFRGLLLDTHCWTSI